MLLVDKNSWHCKIYKWWYFNKYKDSAWDNTAQERSNLCPYMRAVMFWAPIRLLCWDWIKIGKIPTNVFTLPIILVLTPLLVGYASFDLKMFLFFCRVFWYFMWFCERINTFDSLSLSET